MDTKTNINTAVSPPPVFPAKNEAAKEAVAFGKKEVSLSKKEAVSKDDAAGVAEKRKEAPKEAAEVQEVLRKALDVDPIPQRKLQLSIEEELNIVVFKVLDKESGDVVRQIPMPEKISISKDLREAMEKMVDDQSGIAVNEEV